MVLFLQTAIEAIYFCLRSSLKSATDSTTSMGLWAHCTCLSTLPLWELSADDWKKNSGHLITLQTWISLPWRYHVRGATHEDFWNLRPKPNTVSEWKNAQRDANTARWLWYIYIRRAKNFRTVVDSLTRGAEQPKFNQLEMVTAFTYKPSLVKIDARDFELSW